MRSTDWIRVEDRLPMCGERVLVCCKYDDELFPILATLEHSIMGGVKWYDDEGFDFENVTHWMPLVLPKNK